MRFNCHRCLAAALCLAASLAGCSEDPGLQERVNRLQAERQEKDRQLQEAQSALEKTKAELRAARAASKPAAASSPAPSFLPKQQVDDSYNDASKELQKRVAAELKNYTVEDCIEYPVVMPTDERPYRSKVVLLVHSEAGRSYRLEFPVSADPSGRWTFPSAAEVASAVADSRTQEANNAAVNNTPAPSIAPRNATTNGNRPAGQPTSSLVPGQTSTETRVIDWGDGRSTNGGARSNRPTPASAASPAPPSR